MPRSSSLATRLLNRSKNSGLKTLRSIFGLPSAASPGPGRANGNGATRPRDMSNSSSVQRRWKVQLVAVHMFTQLSHV